jgi:electron transfer flavoprotein beta subunit
VQFTYSSKIVHIKLKIQQDKRMKTIVCVKQVVDPEEPPGSFGVDASTNRIMLPPGVPSVISPFDKQAVEAALRVKDETGGSITAISLGDRLDRNVLRDPLAMGVDELILLEDEAFADGDAWSTAYALAMGIKKIGDFELIFCGRQESDWDAGQVGTYIAGILGVPCITVAKKVEIIGKKVRVERVTSSGHEVVEAPLPAVITVSNELGEPRYPTVKQTMAARKFKPVIWNRDDIGVSEGQAGAAGRRLKLLKLYKPVRESKCEMIPGATPEEAGANLAVKLRETNLL